MNFSLHMQTMLLISSSDSIRAGIQQAISTFESVNRILQSSALFRSLSNKSKNGIIIFDAQGKSCYTNATLRQYLPNAENSFDEYIKSLDTRTDIHCFRKMNNRYLDMDGMRLVVEDTVYYAFNIRFLPQKYTPTAGITVESSVEVRNNLDTLLAGSVYLAPFLQELNACCNSPLPTVITGALGTNKMTIARYIQSNSANRQTSFVLLPCEQLSERIWEKLLNNIYNPIHGTGYTVLFQNIHLLPARVQAQIADYINDTNMTKRHKILVTSTQQLSTLATEGTLSYKLYVALNGFQISISPLSQRKEDIPALVNLLINHFNTLYFKTIIGLHEDALQPLMAFPWPMNFQQLESVMHQLVISAKSYYITAADVHRVLSKEMTATSSTLQLDLSQPLEDIERQIIMHVLNEEGMNQTAAAKRLGIGRSTLWRKMS